jgi:hypothetical protein
VQLTPSLAMMNSVTRIDEVSQKVRPKLALTQAWLFEARFRIAQPAMITSGPFVVPTTDNKVVGFSRLRPQELYEYDTAARIIAPLGQYGDTAFAPTLDGSVYAIDGVSGKLLWRYTTDTALAQRPAVVEDDVFLTTVEGHFYRVNRLNGESVWREANGIRDKKTLNVQRFLAANNNYIYVQDQKENLGILDRQRGTLLGTVPTKDFLFAFSNFYTDRVYLAAHNGTLICLRDTRLTKPIVHRIKDAAPANPENQPAPAAPKPKEDKAKDPFKPKDVKPKEDKPKDDKPKDDKPKDDKKKDDKPKDDKPKDDKPQDK